MLNTRKLAPGQNGAKKLQAQSGDRLLGVRYRHDRQLRKRYKTVRLIVGDTAWTSPLLGVARQVKNAGDRWNRAKRLWELPYDQALALGLEARIRTEKASTIGTQPSEGAKTKASDTK